MAEETQDRPPRRRRPAAGATGAQTPPPPTAAPEKAAQPAAAPGKGSTVLQKKLERMLVSLGLPFAAAGDMHCASIFAQRGPVVAEAWANLAAESPAVKEALEAMLKGGAWTGAIGATVGLLIPVAAHHGAPIPQPAAVLFGIRQPQQPEYEEPIQHQPEPVHPERNGHHAGSTVPGPAAFSAPPGPGGIDATDPGIYPGN